MKTLEHRIMQAYWSKCEAATQDTYMLAGPEINIFSTSDGFMVLVFILLSVSMLSFSPTNSTKQKHLHTQQLYTLSWRRVRGGY